MDLHSYCLQLEQERNKWFRKPYWGLLIDRASEEFVWSGGNVRRFPLLRITRPEDLTLRAAHHMMSNEGHVKR
jgi:hypothetical protein